MDSIRRPGWRKKVGRQGSKVQQWRVIVAQLPHEVCGPTFVKVGNTALIPKGYTYARYGNCVVAPYNSPPPLSNHKRLFLSNRACTMELLGIGKPQRVRVASASLPTVPLLYEPSAPFETSVHNYKVASL